MNNNINWYAGKTANNPADMQELCDRIVESTTPANLAEVIKGSESVVVDVAEDNQSLEIHLDNEIQNEITNSLQLPLNAPSATQLVAVGTNKAQTMINIGDGLSLENGTLSGGKRYVHNMSLSYSNGQKIVFSFINDNNTPLTSFQLLYAELSKKFTSSSEHITCSGIIVEDNKYLCVYNQINCYGNGFWISGTRYIISEGEINLVTSTTFAGSTANFEDFVYEI